MKPSEPVVPVTRPSRPARTRVGNPARSKPSVSSNAFDPCHDRLMRRREVQHVTGLSRSSLYRLIALDGFPSPIRLSENAVGWLATEISAWVAERVAATRNGGARPAPAPDGQ